MATCFDPKARHVVALDHGPAALAAMGIGTVTDILRLALIDVTLLGTDIRITATPVRELAPDQGNIGPATMASRSVLGLSLE